MTEGGSGSGRLKKKTFSLSPSAFRLFCYLLMTQSMMALILRFFCLPSAVLL